MTSKPRKSKRPTASDLALALARVVQIQDDAVGLSVSKAANTKAFKSTCGLAIEIGAGTNATLILEERLINRLCDYLGGGIEVPYTKIVGRPMTVTDMVTVEEIGRRACKLPHLAKLNAEVRGVGEYTQPLRTKRYPDVKVFELKRNDGESFGRFAVALRLGEENPLPSISLTETVIDAGTFEVVDAIALWDIARGRIDLVSVELLREWTHQEHPQVIAVLLQLAGAAKAAQVLQHPLFADGLKAEVLLRLARTRYGSPILARAIASHAVAFLNRTGATIHPVGHDYAVDILRAMDSEARDAMMKEVALRDPDWISGVRDGFAAIQRIAS